MTKCFTENETAESAFKKQHCEAETGIWWIRFERFQYSSNALLLSEGKFEMKQEKTKNIRNATQ